MIKFQVIRTEKKVKEFSKRVVVAMTLLWFIAAVFGGAVVWRFGYGLESLLTFVGTPMTGGILGYMLKAAFENKEKIKRSKGEDVNDRELETEAFEP